MQTDIKSTSPVQDDETQVEAQTYTKKIGSTVYQVSIHYNNTSTKTIEDKILCMMKSEVRESA